MNTVIEYNGKPCTTSLLVAECFKKRHSDVIRKIKKLECSADFTRRNFALSEYTDTTGRTLPMYIITKDGFSFLVMGFTGPEAAQFKEEFIAAFNAMQEKIRGKMSKLDMLQMMIDNAREQEERIRRLEAKQVTRPTYFSIAGYASLVGKSIGLIEAATLGRKASKICKQKEHVIESIHDPRFGKVNTYPEIVLKELIK